MATLFADPYNQKRYHLQKMAGQDIYTATGTDTFTVPDRVSFVDVFIVGAGGGDGGGGGEIVIMEELPVNPGATYGIVVGAGGSGNGGYSAFGTFKASGGEVSSGGNGGDGGGGQNTTPGGGASGGASGGANPGDSTTLTDCLSAGSRIVSIPGAGGGAAFASTACVGGDGPFGSGGAGDGSGGNGGGASYGDGGGPGGKGTGYGSGGGNSGLGADGIVKVTYYKRRMPRL
jgi:hypothetical protein